MGSSHNMIKSPYPGPRPFRPDECNLFYGRAVETEELISLLTANSAVLLHSPSGAGKTSLLNTAFVAGERDGRAAAAFEAYEVLPPARVRAALPSGIREADLANVYTFNALAGWAPTARPDELRDKTLLQYLSRKDKLRIVIFDQFEEIFTARPLKIVDRSNFFIQVAEALEYDPLLRAIFSMREEYLARMAQFEELMPGQALVRYRLDRLSREAAFAAVARPAEEFGCYFDAEAARELVRRLSRIRTTGIEGQMLEIEGESVEPALLQVVCSRIWRHHDSGRDRIGSDEIERFADVSVALGEFYEKAVVEAANAIGGPQFVPQLRLFCASHLITPFRTRGLVVRGINTTGGVPNAAIDELQQRHIVRAEERGGAKWVELMHDLLIDPILESNATRQWLSDAPSVFSSDTLSVWLAKAEAHLRRERKLRMQFAEPVEIILDRMPDTEEYIRTDKLNAWLLFASKVLDGAFGLATRVSTDVYAKLEGVWLEDVKRFMAYLLWEKRGDGFDPYPQRHFCDVCGAIERRLGQVVPKADELKPDAMRRYFAERYPQGSKAREQITSRKAYRLWELLGMPADRNWHLAAEFVTAFYDNIAPALSGNDPTAAAAAFDALRCRDGYPGHLLSNCLEVAVAICCSAASIGSLESPQDVPGH